MPRIRQYANEYRNKDFVAEIEKQKVMAGIKTDKELAELLHISPATLCLRKKNPDRITVEDLRYMIQKIGISKEAVLALVGYKI